MDQTQGQRTGKTAVPVIARILAQPYQRGLLVAIILGFVLAPILMGAVIFDIAREFARGRELRIELNQSYEERSQMQTVFSLAQDAETGQRGYIITGQMMFLEPFDSAQAQMSGELAKLESMQKADGVTYPAKPKMLADLRRLITQRMTGMKRSIMIRDTQGEAAATAIVARGRGKVLMDQIRSLVAQMSAEENKALEQRIAFSQADAERTETRIEGMFAALALLLLAAYALVLRQAHTQQKLLVRVQAAAARQTAIFENAQDGIVTFNPNGAIEAINRAAETMFGHARADIEGQDIATLLDLPPQERLFLQLSADHQVEAGMTRELLARRRSGETFPVEASLGLIALPEGDRIVASLRDISERRRIETMKAEFVSTVSHELRTPLTSITGSLGLLLGGAGGALSEAADKLLTIAQTNSKRLMRLINDILDIEKIESGQMRFDMAPLDLADLGRRVMEEVSGMAIERQVTLEIHAAPGVPQVRGDADRLGQVIANLLSNAIKFSPFSGTVSILVESGAPGWVRLSVRDRGTGIPVDFRSRIFSKFAQADSSDTRQRGGTGLGLAISKEITERHSGRLSFDSIPGAGATFFLDLPSIS